MKAIKWSSLNRKLHFWGSIIASLPVLIILITGGILLFKKQSDWIQPSTKKGEGVYPVISFDDILLEAKGEAVLNVKDWSDVDRLDVRPGKGIVKIRANNGWELQLDTQNKKHLNLAYRRSDLIEAIHTGTFFHDYVSLGVFFPATLILLLLWVTGLYLFYITIRSSRRKKRRLDRKNS